MGRKIVSLFAALVLLCTAPSLSLAQGADPKKPADKARAIEKLNSISNGDLSFSEKEGQYFLSGKLSGRQTAGTAAALRFLQDNAALFGIGSAADELARVKADKDGGDTFIRFAQVIQGVQAEGYGLTVHFDRNGVVESVNGSLLADRTVTALGKTVLPGSAAVEIAEKRFTFNSLRRKPQAEKLITAVDGKNYLAYKVDIAFTDPEIVNCSVYVEAHTGKVLRTQDNIIYDMAPDTASETMPTASAEASPGAKALDATLTGTTGWGVDVTGVTRSLNLSRDGAYYQMIDNARSEATAGILTFACNPYPNYSIEQSTTNHFTAENTKASVSAHYFAGQVIDFYKNLFNRNSLDDDKMEIDSFTHCIFKGDGPNNAAWDGYEMLYGDGDGKLFTYLSGDLDVVGHEMTHGVVTNTANLDYHNQPGALNESLADTFGVLIETYSKDNVAGGGTWAFRPADWVVGDQVLTPHVPGDALRSLANPHAGYTWQPDKMSEYKSLPDNDKGDNGGVHVNSGIPNKAAFLVAKSIGMEATAEIYYRALTDYLGMYSDFANARLCLEQAARDLYGEGSEEEAAVGSAFISVGVGDKRAAAHEIYSGVVYQSYISSKTDEAWYKFSIYTAGTIHVDLTDIPSGCDYDLYLYSSVGETPLAYAFNSNSPTNSFDYNADGAGEYYLQIYPYEYVSNTSMYSLSFTAPGSPATGISLGSHTARLEPGDSLALAAAVNPADAANQRVAWSSSDPSVATVSSLGTVKAKGMGTATITATAADGGFTDACSVTVARFARKVSLNRHATGFMAGDTQKLSAAVYPSDATDKTVAWSSSDDSIVSVDASGTITGVTAGTATVTATTEDGSFRDSCTVAVVSSLAAPSQKAPVSISCSSVRVSWSEVYGANSYEVYRSASASGNYVKAGSTALLSYTDGGLTPGTAYFYKVRAIRAANPAATADSVALSCKPLPGAPPSFEAASASYRSIRLTWRAVPGITKYEISRAATKTGNYKPLAETGTLSYTDSGVPTGTTYYYKVRAYCLVEKAKVFGTSAPIVTAAAKLSVPASVKAARVSSSRIKITWAKVPGASQYLVYRSTLPSGKYALMKTTSRLYYTNTGLKAGTTYYYKVLAYRVVARKKVYSKYSAVVHATP